MPELQSRVLLCCCALSQLTLPLDAAGGDSAVPCWQNYLQTAKLRGSALVPCATEISLKAGLYLSNKKAFQKQAGALLLHEIATDEN